MDRVNAQTGLIAAGLLLSFYTAPAIAADALELNGKIASTDVRQINGSAYVKLADLARALGMVITRRADGKYELTTAGGANQVDGLRQGKIGDVLFDGRWRFQVLSVDTPDSYTMQTPGVEPSSWPRDIIDYNATTRVLRAKPGYKLVVVNCRMRNGQKTSERFWLSNINPEENIHNALANKDGSSDTPVGFDLESGPAQSKELLPGARLDFPILFSVRQATELEDLVFTLKNNGEGEPHDVRVSLVGTPAAGAASNPNSDTTPAAPPPQNANSDTTNR